MSSIHEDEGNANTAVSRRMRKRELDRRCQKISRDKKRARIAYLEGLMKEFQQRDSSGHVATLMQQISDITKSRDELAKTFYHIQKSVQNHRNVLNEQGRPRLNEVNPYAATEPISGVTCPVAEVQCVDSVQRVDAEPEVASGRASTIEESSFSSNREHLIDDPIFPHSEDGGCECCSQSARSSYSSTVNLWRFANEVLTRPLEVSYHEEEFEDDIDEDIAIRALLEGWDAVVKQHGGRLSQSWSKLRSIDEVIFGRCDPKERLAILRLMHALMRFHITQTDDARRKVPHWYLQRPSQALAHSYAIDFFAWPGLRERFVFHQHRYCGNIFWHLFCNSLRINWQYGFRECYTRNSETGKYKITAAFDYTIGDIEAWTMRADIFKRWPEFYADFPRSLDHLPVHLSSRLTPLPNTRTISKTILETGTQEDAQEYAQERTQRNVIEEQAPMLLWDSLQAAIIDASSSALPDQDLVDLLGRNDYKNFREAGRGFNL